MTRFTGTIRKATPADAALIGDIAADAFSDDPIALWTAGSSKALPALFRTMAAKVYIPRGLCHIAEGDAGCTMWMPPNGSKHLGAWPTLRIITEVLRHGGFTALRRNAVLEKLMEANAPKDPRYYLFVIAVRQTHHGQGVGGRLLDPVLARCDEEGMPAYLENTKEGNLGFYQSRGFTVVNEERAAPDAPPMWFMRREPKT